MDAILGAGRWIEGALAVAASPVGLLLLTVGHWLAGVPWLRPGATGWAIVALTLVVRSALVPVVVMRPQTVLGGCLRALALMVVSLLLWQGISAAERLQGGAGFYWVANLARAGREIHAGGTELILPGVAALAIGLFMRLMSRPFSLAAVAQFTGGFELAQGMSLYGMAITLVLIAQSLSARLPGLERLAPHAPEVALHYRAQVPVAGDVSLDAEGVEGLGWTVFASLSLGGMLAQHWDLLIPYLVVAVPAGVAFFALHWTGRLPRRRRRPAVPTD